MVVLLFTANKELIVLLLSILAHLLLLFSLHAPILQVVSLSEYELEFISTPSQTKEQFLETEGQRKRKGNEEERIVQLETHRNEMRHRQVS